MDEARQAGEGGPGSRLLERLVERIGGRANAAAVFGTPVVQGDVTVIPVARVRWGFGGGGGDSEADRASGSGGGGGVAADPLGFIEIRADGATFRPIGPSLPSPILLIAVAIAAGIVIRAIGNALTRSGARS